MNVLQPWLANISMMQQTVLLTAVRGPDGLPKYHPTKYVLRWYRRCILLSAMDGAILNNPADENGGSFTGPSFSNIRQHIVAGGGVGAVVRIDYSKGGWEPEMNKVVSDYLRALDEVPHHFHMHLLHAVQILGYKHPDPVISRWWLGVYQRFVHDMHLWPESEAEMDKRLGDTREGWAERADSATKD